MVARNPAKLTLLCPYLLHAPIDWRVMVVARLILLFAMVVCLIIGLGALAGSKDSLLDVPAIPILGGAGLALVALIASLCNRDKGVGSVVTFGKGLAVCGLMALTFLPKR